MLVALFSLAVDFKVHPSLLRSKIPLDILLPRTSTEFSSRPRPSLARSGAQLLVLCCGQVCLRWLSTSVSSRYGICEPTSSPVKFSTSAAFRPARPLMRLPQFSHFEALLGFLSSPPAPPDACALTSLHARPNHYYIASYAR